MPVTLTYTPGGASDNSLVTLAEADAHFANQLNSSVNGDWFNDSAGVARTDDVRKAALITMTLRIDEETFRGYKASTTQALKWPRVGVVDEDGIAFSSLTIPARVKQAVYSGSRELLKYNFIDEDYLKNFSFFMAGGVQFKQFTPLSAGALPADVQRLLRFVMIGGSNGGRLMRA